MKNSVRWIHGIARGVRLLALFCNLQNATPPAFRAAILPISQAKFTNLAAYGIVLLFKIKSLEERAALGMTLALIKTKRIVLNRRYKMASSSPPRDAIQSRPLPPKASPSESDPFSPALQQAFGFLDQVRNAGLAFAPAMPEPKALQAAAQKAGISPMEALQAYLTILHYES